MTTNARGRPGPGTGVGPNIPVEQWLFSKWPSILKPVVNEFDHLILKINQSTLVFPPVLDTVARWFDGMHYDADARRGYFVPERPAHASSWKQLGRNDHAFSTATFSPVEDRARLFVSARDASPNPTIASAGTPSLRSN